MSTLFSRFYAKSSLTPRVQPRLRLVGTDADADADAGSVRIERICAEIHAGTYETQARLDAATDRLLARLRG